MSSIGVAGQAVPIRGSYNPDMHSLRRFRWLACFMLAWWALSLAAAAASPFGVLSSVERICSGAGPVQFMVAGDPDTIPPVGHTLDCPLCLPAAAPAPALGAAWSVASAPAHALCAVVAAPRAERMAAPWQARGPPDILL